MKSTLFFISILSFQLLFESVSMADCVGVKDPQSIDVKIVKTHAAYYRKQKIEGCLIEAFDLKSGNKITGFTSHDFICGINKNEIIKIKIDKLCCDAGDFPEPCGVTSRGILGIGSVKAEGTVLNPVSIDKRSFSQLKTHLTSKDFLLIIRAFQSLEKISERKPFLAELETLLKSDDYRLKGEAAYLLLSSSDMTWSSSEKWKLIVFALNSISDEHAKEALKSFNTKDIAPELQITTLDSVMDDLHHSGRTDLLLEVLKKVNEPVLVTLISKRLDPESASVIPANAIEDTITLGTKAKGLEARLVNYVRYPYFGSQHREKAAQALCSINGNVARKHIFDSGKLVIKCNPVVIEYLECLKSSCQK